MHMFEGIAVNAVKFGYATRSSKKSVTSGHSILLLGSTAGGDLLFFIIIRIGAFLPINHSPTILVCIVACRGQAVENTLGRLASLGSLIQQ